MNSTNANTMCKSCKFSCNKILFSSDTHQVGHAHHGGTRQKCLKTPPWMMFAFCHAPMDGYAAFLWHDLRGPFPLPVNLKGIHSILPYTLTLSFLYTNFLFLCA